MTAADLSKFEPSRRYATLFAMATESKATVTDEIIDLHDRIIGRLIRTAQNKQNQATLASRSTVAAMMRLHSRLGDALFAAKENSEDPFAAIETSIGWESLAESIAQAKELTRPGLEDHLALVSTHFTTLRRYTPAFLAVLDLHAAPAAQDLLAAINVIRALNTTGARKDPGRCTDLVYPAPVGAAGLHRQRPGPGLLRVLRSGGTEECPAFRRYVGHRITSVPRLR